MNLWQKFMDNTPLRRVVVLALMCFSLWLVRSMMTLILLTFILTFINLRLTETLHRYLKIPERIALILIYVVAIGGVYLTITTYLPHLVNQTNILISKLIDFYRDNTNTKNQLLQYISKYLSSNDISTQAKNGFTVVLHYLSSVGNVSFSYLMALILSFFFVLEKKQTYHFSKMFLHGPSAWLFNDVFYFAKKFGNTFGVVLETQLLIAICNTAITGIALAFLQFPQLLVLTVFIFFMSLIPVAGVIISAIPLSFIAYYDGGLRYVIYIIILLLVVHAFEAYFLNPKFMSARTELPIFYTFIILLFGEELCGVWGLIVGIPIFTFVLDLLGVKPIRTPKAPQKTQKPTD